MTQLENRPGLFVPEYTDREASTKPFVLAAFAEAA